MNDFFDRLKRAAPSLDQLPPVDLSPRLDSREVDIVKRGEAIAHVRALEAKVVQLESLNSRLEATIARVEDRMNLLDEERQKYRADANTYLAMLMELSTDMANVNLLTQRAQETRERVLTIIQAVQDHPIQVVPSAAPSAASEALRDGSHSPFTPEEEAPVASVQAGPSAESREPGNPPQAGRRISPTL